MIRLAFQEGHSGSLRRMCWRPTVGCRKMAHIEHIFCKNTTKSQFFSSAARCYKSTRKSPVETRAKSMSNQFVEKEKVKTTLNLIRDERNRSEISNQAIRQGHDFRPSIGKGWHFDTTLCWGGWGI